MTDMRWENVKKEMLPSLIISKNKIMAKINQSDKYAYRGRGAVCAGICKRS